MQSIEMKKILLIIYILFQINSLNASELTLINLQEIKLTTKGLSYILNADKKIIDPKKLKKLNFFNRGKVISNAVYYLNGDLAKRNIKVKFEKAYFVDGNLYMQNCYSDYDGGYIKAKSAVYKKDYIEFKNLFMLHKNKKYKKFKYIVETK